MPLIPDQPPTGDPGTPTIAELLDAAHARIGARMDATDNPRSKREYALAKTAIEDARMRATRGIAHDQDVFQPIDLEKFERQG